jgi:hypothetical protein
LPFHSSPGLLRPIRSSGGHTCCCETPQLLAWGLWGFRTNIGTCRT